jgi:hypothetical protein
MKDNTTIIIGGLAIAGVLAYLIYKKTLTATTAGQLSISPSGVNGTINLQPIESALGGIIGAAFAPSGTTQQNNNPASGVAYTGVSAMPPSIDTSDDSFLTGDSTGDDEFNL